MSSRKKTGMIVDVSGMVRRGFYSFQKQKKVPENMVTRIPLQNAVSALLRASDTSPRILENFVPSKKGRPSNNSTLALDLFPEVLPSFQKNNLVCCVITPGSIGSLQHEDHVKYTKLVAQACAMLRIPCLPNYSEICKIYQNQQEKSSEVSNTSNSSSSFSPTFPLPIENKEYVTILQSRSDETRSLVSRSLRERDLVKYAIDVMKPYCDKLQVISDDKTIWLQVLEESEKENQDELSIQPLQLLSNKKWLCREMSLAKIQQDIFSLTDEEKLEAVESRRKILSTSSQLQKYVALILHKRAKMNKIDALRVLQENSFGSDVGSSNLEKMLRPRAYKKFKAEQSHYIRYYLQSLWYPKLYPQFLAGQQMAMPFAQKEQTEESSSHIDVMKKDEIKKMLNEGPDFSFLNIDRLRAALDVRIYRRPTHGQRSLSTTPKTGPPDDSTSKP